MKIKNCSNCNKELSCHSDNNCWCSTYPTIKIDQPDKDCLCPSCLKKIIEYIDSHTVTRK